MIIQWVANKTTAAAAANTTATTAARFRKSDTTSSSSSSYTNVVLYDDKNAAISSYLFMIYFDVTARVLHRGVARLPALATRQNSWRPSQPINRYFKGKWLYLLVQERFFGLDKCSFLHNSYYTLATNIAIIATAAALWHEGHTSPHTKRFL